ncbi:LacI family DNA-binding transcriptional regulator [Vallicoccus soli]|uniref:LacI family transcriptional regulator n=1 Tax=Vallicoccus soli TaxID=2339232 RepID=A0A3A3Z482_9ACTN|nr:LacI family DNA-binding transcriptional regulator [Vallicoccus soli]RJK97773.1 LacI family transcriptional regulator [Vallicoccus soli]
MPSGPVTLADVARAADVSLATASRVLNGSVRTVGPVLREQVLAAAAELGYRPNPAAQAMARGASDLVGLVVPDITDPWDAEVAAGVLEVAREMGLLVSVVSTGHDPELELEHVSSMRNHRARAVVLAGSRTSGRDVGRRLAAEVEGFELAGGRVAVLGQRTLGTDTLLLENRPSAKALAASLVEQGFERFHVLAGPKELVTARDRVAGFKDGTAGGRKSRLGEVVNGALSREGGYEAALELAASVDLRGSCVLAVSDTVAVGALAALRERKLKVPQDVALAGFDDLPVGRETTPALTTVALPLRDLGRRLADLALGPLPEDDGVRVERVPGEVVHRASTKRRR